MLKNYIKIAFRNLWRQKGYSLINIVGLAIGMACCLFIVIYVLHELHYDRFHEKADRIYRVTTDRSFGDQETHSAMSPPGFAELLERTMPEVEQVTRIWRDPPGTMVVRYKDRGFREDGVIYADSSLFNIFSFPLHQGNPQVALRDPYSIVITEWAARKYFGDEDPMGKTLILRVPADNDLWEYQVTGVVANPPSRSHLQFDFIASFNSHWMSASDEFFGLEVYTYLLLRNAADPDALEKRLPEVLSAYAGSQIQEQAGTPFDTVTESGERYRFLLQPLTSIHLHSHLDHEFGLTGDILYVYFFVAVALFVLLLACANFVNLSTALADRRAREIGVRKALGSGRGDLIRQFLAESVLFSFLALSLAVLLVEALLPTFSQIGGKDLAAILPPVVVIVPIVIGFAILIGLTAGCYPAFVLSSFRVQTILKTGNTAGGVPRLRNALIVFQLTVSVVLMIGTVVIGRQMRFVQEERLGFEEEQVIVLKGAEVMKQKIETFKQEVLALPGVSHVTNSELVPGRPFPAGLFRLAAMPEDALMPVAFTYTGFGYAETFGLEITEGRSLSSVFAEDSLAVLLNETAVERLGLRDPLRKQLVGPPDGSIYTIVGVVQDFHVASLRQKIGPVALLGPNPENVNRPNLLVSVRVATNDVSHTITALRNIWQNFAPNEPFVYSFLDQNFDALYHQERFHGLLFRVFAAIALFLACIGLLGLTALAAKRRTKEIGIRKVLGASIAGIVALLSKDFLKLVVVGFVIATPIAWYVMNQWLADFAYRIEIGPGIFLLAGGVAILIALATVSWQAVKAALMNPVESLKDD